MLYYPQHKSFADVEQDYNRIKPMVSKNHSKACDIRPIGDRRRKQERIMKLDDNCYALLDWDSPDNTFWCSWYKTYDPGKVSKQEIRDYAPVLWERLPDGSELVHVRNGVGQGAHNGRYAYLERVLPMGLEFVIDNGKQFVRYQNKRYYLPKGKFFHDTFVEAVQAEGNNKGYYRDLKKGENDELVFKRDGDKWLIQNEHLVPKPPRQVVRKGVKEKYKDALTSLREYVFAMAPICVVEDNGSWYRRHSWEQEQNLRQEFIDKVHEEYPALVNEMFTEHGNGFCQLNSMHPRLALQIITDYNDTLRFYIAYQFGISSDICTMSNADDVKRVKGQYNRFINKLCGFTEVVND